MADPLDRLSPASALTGGLGTVATTPETPNANEAGGGPAVPDTGAPLFSTTSYSIPDLPERNTFNPLLVEHPLPNSPLPPGPVDEGTFTYAGSDMRVVVEVGGSSQAPRQLVELTTITVSVHREKSPGRALGYINPKGYARGRRTIAGTMILTQFAVEPFFRYLGAQYVKDLSKDSTYFKVDQLPPFNLTLIFADEFGHSSYRRVLGVEMVTDGVVYSSNDMMSEQSITYVAADFTPLLPTQMSPVANNWLVTPSYLKPGANAGGQSVTDLLQQKQGVSAPGRMVSA